MRCYKLHLFPIYKHKKLYTVEQLKLKMADKREKIFRLSWVYRFVFTWALFLILVLVFLVFPYYNLNVNSEFYIISLFISIMTITIILFSFEINVDLTFDDNAKEAHFHNVNLKSAEELIKYYNNEVPVQSKDGSVEIPANSVWNFGMGIQLDRLKAVRSDRRYNLPNEFLINRSRLIAYTLNRPKREFYPYDRICVCMELEKIKFKESEEYIFHVQKAILADEYATIQNPDDDISGADFNEVKTARDIVSNNGFLPQILKNNKDNIENRLPYRLAMHVIIETSDGYILLQKRSSKRVATSASEITSSAGGGMDWRDFSRARSKGIKRFVYREIREETTLSRANFKELRVRSVIREFRRLGQPVLILTGKINIPYREVVDRLEKSKRFARSPWLYPYWYFLTFLTGKSGREYWEMDSLLAVKGNQIKDIIQNSNVQPPTKVGLLTILEDVEKL